MRGRTLQFRFQYRLCTLFLGIAVVAVAARALHRAGREWETIKGLRSAGAVVRSSPDGQEPALDGPFGPLERLWGPRADSVLLIDHDENAEVLHLLYRLPHLRSLDYTHYIPAFRVDKGTATQRLRLCDLPRLEELYLYGDAIGDAELETVGQLKALTAISLAYTAVTDESIARLAGLKQLTFLMITHTPVTEVACTRLAAALPECNIILNGTPLEPNGRSSEGGK